MPMEFMLIALSIVAAGILDLDEDQRVAWVKDEIEKGWLDPAWMNQYRAVVRKAMRDTQAKASN